MRIRSVGGWWFSLIVHTFVLVALLGAWKSPRLLQPQHLPGTAKGTQRLLTYSVGGAPPQARASLQRRLRPTDAAVPRPHLAAIAKPQPASVTTSAPGAGTGGESALGDGNISIALVKFHPRPTPDLSSLPHGTSGDVVLDAVIDAEGRIAGLKVARGFGGSIDQIVVATVQQWTFSPATRDGVPVASEQEILFHYERS